MNKTSEDRGNTGTGPSPATTTPNPTSGRLVDAGPHPGIAGAPSPAGAVLRPPLVDSAELLRGHTSIEISHQGVLYRLQATRLGKLILTK